MTTIASTGLAPDIISNEIDGNKLAQGKDSFENLIRGKSDKEGMDKSHLTGGMDEFPNNIVALFEQKLRNSEGKILAGGAQIESLGKAISSSVERTATVKIAGKQESKIVFNKNEQKALPTYVMSYVNTSSSDVEAHISSSVDGTLKSQYAANNVYAETVTHFFVNEKNVSAVNQFNEMMISGKTEKDNESKIGFSYLRTFYEKLKITVLGDKEKTVVVRDYYSDDVYAVTDFQKTMTSENIHVKKLIVNGKEV